MTLQTMIICFVGITVLVLIVLVVLAIYNFIRRLTLGEIAAFAAIIWIFRKCKFLIVTILIIMFYLIVNSMIADSIKV
jgi:hypothetical protein